MTRMSVVASLFATATATAAAAAGTVDLSGSTVTLRGSEMPGALAEVMFDNVNRNGPHDEGVTTLTWGGIEVEVSFHWNVNDDSDDAIVIVPPEGVICVPSCELVLKEGYSGVVTLFDLSGVGM